MLPADLIGGVELLPLMAVTLSMCKPMLTLWQKALDPPSPMPAASVPPRASTVPLTMETIWQPESAPYPPPIPAAFMPPVAEILAPEMEI